MNVTLRQLRVFIEVARLQSFSRAGDEIGLTQSAVSRCVRELEGEIGLKLIDRTTREVQLTDVGGNLVSSVSRLLTDLDDALARDPRNRRAAPRTRGGGREPDGGVPADAARGGGVRTAVSLYRARVCATTCKATWCAR